MNEVNSYGGELYDYAKTNNVGYGHLPSSFGCGAYWLPVWGTRYNTCYNANTCLDSISDSTFDSSAHAYFSCTDPDLLRKHRARLFHRVS